MSLKARSVWFSLAMALVAAPAWAQSPGSSVLTLRVPEEASLQVRADQISVAASGEITGRLDYTYQIRTATNTGTANVSLGIANTRQLVYSCKAQAPAKACAGTRVADGKGLSPVARFGANAHSSREGNSGAIEWRLPPAAGAGHDPVLIVTISAI